MITTGDFQEALEPIARKNFFLGVREIPAELEMFYDVVQSDKLTETYLEMGDVGETDDFNGNLDYDEMEEGRTLEITAVEKAKGMKIQRKFVRTDQLDIARSLPKMLGLSARRRIATDIFYPFNYAFSTSFTTIDTNPLCYSAHTSGHEEGVNQSNAGSTAFSAVSLSAARTAMKKFLTNRANKFEVDPDLILCGTDLEEAVWEAVNSVGKTDTANNNKNFHASRAWKVISTRWLDDTNDWFVIDSELMKQFLVWNVLDKLDFKQAEDFDGFNAKYASYMFYGFGARQWEWIYGSQVS